jgi:hypothetical protein
MRVIAAGSLAAGALLAAARPARADEAVEAQATDEEPRGGRWLELDPTLRLRLEGLGALEETDRRELRLGRRTRVVLEGTRWANEDGEPLPYIDLPARGWRTTLRISRDVGGGLRLGATASVNEVDSRFGSGAHVDIGLSLGRTFRLSRWMTGWISLGVGWRRWLGEEPPAGEAGGTEAMLRIGTTFR